MSSGRFAQRAGWELGENALARRARERRERGLPLLDLTDSNPTRAGLPELAEALAAGLAGLAQDPASAAYAPEPRGPAAARAAVAADFARRGADLDPRAVVLTAGTSEGYAHLFRLLADPGERVLVPAPGYPLFAYLAGLEGVEAETYPLRYPGPEGAWRIDLAALAARLDPRTRAVLVVHPNNPTGSRVHADDLAAARALCRERGAALIADEVFADYGFDGSAARTVLAEAGDGPLHFALSGTSKALGLPQLKLAWMGVAGPARECREALERLEVIADTYLSVSPLLAARLPALLARREAVQQAILARVTSNRERLAAELSGTPGLSLLPADGGWAAIAALAARARGPAHDEEALCMALLERHGVLAHPGFFFELEASGPPRGSAHLVVSLLAPPAEFARGASALASICCP